MKQAVALSGIVALALVAACSDAPIAVGEPHQITVMTRNVYVGADVDQVMLATSPEELLARVEAAWQELEATDFAERAEELADEILAAEPHLVGLQEITLIRTQSPGDAVLGGTVPAEEVAWDYLAILMAELAERGLDYRVAGMIEDTDVEMPRANPTFDDVRMTDYDVVLARGDVQVSNVESANYVALLPVPTPGGELQVRRGWVALDAEVGDETYRFVNTHLEPADFTDQIQAMQVAELLVILSGETLPVILVGDLNSRADGSGTPTYQTLLDAGFQDAWIVSGGEQTGGLTCCHALDLRNPTANFDERIDYILLRDAQVIEAEAWVVGDDPANRTASGMWPSDHGGVVVRLTVDEQ